MSVLRFIAVALVASGTLVPLDADAVAEPLDKEACLKLQADRKKLLTREMQTALEHGPDWVKNHLDSGEIEKVRAFLAIEELIEFRCRGEGVVAKALQNALANPDGVPLPDRKPTPPPGSAAPGNTGTEAADGGDSQMPLPDRNPAAAERTIADVKPSQTVADSDKTPPSKAKATR